MRYFDRRANSAGAGEVVVRWHDQRPLRVRLGRSLWSSRAPASPSPADLRRDNRVVALGPMLSPSDRFRFMENRGWCGAIFFARSQRRYGMVDGLGAWSGYPDEAV